MADHQRMRVMALVCAVVVGCGGGGGAPDARGTSDARRADAATSDAAAIDAEAIDAPPDAPTCPAPLPTAIGGACATDAQCDSTTGAGDGVCFAGAMTFPVPAQWPAAGYCSRDCTSAPGACGAGATCSTAGICVPDCCAGLTCAAGFACSDQLLGAALGTFGCVPGNPAAADGSPCVGIADCDGGAQCVVDVEHPGGECSRQGCTVGTDATCSPGGDGHCAVLPDQVVQAPGCVDACAVGADCRLAEGYHCVDAGGAIGRYCRATHIADACANDTECGDPGIWDCLTGAAYPGGSCSVPCTTPGSTVGCAPGSGVCAEAGATDYCVDRCPNAGIGTQSTCRIGYTCRDVDPGAGEIGGCVSP